MKLTREQAITEHRMMWNWIADQIEEAKAVLSIWMLKRKYCDENGFSEITAHCFLCDYVDNLDQDHFGPCKTTCPIKWPGSETCGDDIYLDKEGLYDSCRMTNKWQEQAALARQIANLPERTDE